MAHLFYILSLILINAICYSVSIPLDSLCDINLSEILSEIKSNKSINVTTSRNESEIHIRISGSGIYQNAFEDDNNEFTDALYLLGNLRNLSYYVDSDLEIKCDKGSSVLSVRLEGLPGAYTFTPEFLTGTTWIKQIDQKIHYFNDNVKRELELDGYLLGVDGCSMNGTKHDIIFKYPCYAK